MSVLDRYILREWLAIFGLLLAATTGLLLVMALYDNFRDILDTGASPGEMLFYYAVLLPSYFSVVLPLALLLSLLFILGKLHRNNEIMAMRAAGLNIFRTTRPLWFACIALCGLSLLLNARVCPWSVETSGQLLDRFEMRAQKRDTGQLGMVQSVTFDNRREGRMWFINRYNRFAAHAYGVTVSLLDRQRRETVRLTAREAVYDQAARRWTFLDGRRVELDPERGDVTRAAAFARWEAPEYEEDPTLMLLIDRKAGDLSFFELRRIVEFFRAEDNPKVLRYAVRYYTLLADTLGPLIVLAIAIPFAVSGVRVSPVVGVSKSIGLFFLYYLLTSVANALGSRGYLDPLWAAAGPNLAMIGLAAWFFGRLR